MHFDNHVEIVEKSTHDDELEHDVETLQEKESEVEEIKRIPRSNIKKEAPFMEEKYND